MQVRGQRVQNEDECTQAKLLIACTYKVQRTFGTVRCNDTLFKVMGTIASQLKALSQNTPQSSIILYPDRAPLKEVLGGQYNYREGGRQVLRQGAKGRRRNRKWQCSKDPCAQKVSGGRTDPSPKYRWKVHG